MESKHADLAFATVLVLCLAGSWYSSKGPTRSEPQTTDIHPDGAENGACVVRWLIDRLEQELPRTRTASPEVATEIEQQIAELDNQLQLMRAGIVDEPSDESLEAALILLSRARSERASYGKPRPVDSR